MTATEISFEPEAGRLNLIPVPDDLLDMNSLPITGLECLDNLEPIDSFEGLALQLALLTGIVRSQQARIEELENVNRND